MKLVLTMNMDNAAFGDGSCVERSEEVVRVLSGVMVKLQGMHEDSKFEPGWKHKLLDSNGNRIGMIEVSA